jgi:hypothetical protein
MLTNEEADLILEYYNASIAGKSRHSLRELPLPTCLDMSEMAEMTSEAAVLACMIKKDETRCLAATRATMILNHVMDRECVCARAPQKKMESIPPIIQKTMFKFPFYTAD